MAIYKFIKISIGNVIKNPETSKFVSHHFKTKKIYKHAAKKLPFLTRYVGYQYIRLNKQLISIFEKMVEH